MNAVPRISMDYLFLGGADTEAKDTPMFVMLDDDNGNRYARLVEHTGLVEDGVELLILGAAVEIRAYPEGIP